MTVTHVSLHTFVAVRIISSRKSTAKMMLNPSIGSPRAVRMITNITKLAIGIPAAPMEVTKAVTTTITCAPKVNSMP